MNFRSGIVLTGPTGVGKTDLTIRLADLIRDRGRRAEIVSADAVSIFKELEIGTAKPDPADRKRIRHHLMDIRSVGETAGRTAAYSAGEFSKDFFALFPKLQDPIIVSGGTAFYIDAVVRGLAKNPPADEELRQRLSAMEIACPGAVYDRLKTLDPKSAQKIGPDNLQRLIRAVEVCETHGRFSEQPRRPTPFKPLIFVLTLNRADLNRGIDTRTRRMFSEGLPEEVERLLKRFPPDLPAFSAIGYAEAVQMVMGRMSPEEALESTARRTRRLAKRQLTWWRNFRYERVCIVPADVSPSDILDKWKE